MERLARGDTIDISIHSLRMEGDVGHPQIFIQTLDFNPLPPHGGRLYPTAFPEIAADISIHSLRMEGDPLDKIPVLTHPRISIHSLRMEGDKTQRLLYPL